MPHRFERLPGWLALGLGAAAVAVGLELRFADAGSQIVGGDELHAVFVAIAQPWLGVLGYYGVEDNSVPYTLYAKALTQLGVLDETTLRIPVMASGVLLLLCPWWLRREIGRGAALAAIALSATSPPMIFYSLYARPYAPAALCLMLAVVAWSRWLGSGRSRAAFHFALLSVAAIFFHLYCVFPIAALYVFALARARNERSLRRPLAMAVGLSAAALLVLFAPGLPALVATRAAKLGGTPLDPVTFRIVFGQLTGHLAAVEWLLLALCAIGLIALQRRAPLLGHGIAVILIVQVLALLATRPLGKAGSWARYYYDVWPLWLIAAGVGLSACVRAAGRIVRAQQRTPWLEVATAAAGLALASCVPLVSPAALFRAKPSSFRTNKAMLQRLWPLDGAEPATWRALLARPDHGDVLLVSPYVSANTGGIALAQLQMRAGMWIEMADTDVPLQRQSGVVYRHAVDLGSASELASTRARYLLLDLEAGGARLRDALRARLGEPLAVDEKGELYDLAPVTRPAED